MSQLTSNSSLQLTAQIAQNMIASRSIVRLTDVGETKRFHIRGNGNVIPVLTKDGAQVMASGTDNVPLMKTIYNVKANSHVAMLNSRNQEILRAAMTAEKEGDDAAAHNAFNQYLNKIQVSFSVILNPGRKAQTFYDGQLVEGEIELVTTENGQLLTISNPRPVKIEKLAATPAFTLADLMGIEEVGPTAENTFIPGDGIGADAGVKTEEKAG